MTLQAWSKMGPFSGRLYIFGAGGFGREVAWLARQTFGGDLEMKFMIDATDGHPALVHGIEVLPLSAVENPAESRFVVAVGSPRARQEIVLRCRECGLSEATIVHPRVEASETVMVGPGSIICAGVIATVDISIGSHVHVNLDSTIGHDVKIEDFVTVSPGVHISGNVHIRKGAFIGTGASIIEGRHGKPLVIGEGAVVGAGACVIEDVPPGAMVAGVPAKRKK